MFFIDEPYVSDFLKSTLRDHSLPVVNTEISQKMKLLPGTILLSEAEAIQLAEKNESLRIYTTSENSIGWIAQHFSFLELPEKIELFKNKAKFRQMIQSLYPDFYFREVQVRELNTIPFEEIPLPFVIKPTTGFFSLGVHVVNNQKEWIETINTIHSEIDQITGMYPDEVLNVRSFIIEQSIDGDEFAVDAYFNDAGDPVILNILHHTFSSDSDVSDRVYTTSKEIVEANLQEFTAFLDSIGKLAGIRNFPVHVELRRSAGGQLLPIEVNPMRFGGWCSTPDLAYHAYGINPYLYFQNQIKPDWPRLLENKQDKLFSVVILDNSTDIPTQEIQSFDYETMLSSFEKPLELRKIDYEKYPVFAFLFVETRTKNRAELDRILKSDLREYIQIKPENIPG